ncbi:MAG: hypothetical protein P1P89_12915 [Desulfobacterales bacterium]|nr:hypothetical protein [Desulfobacterales bacterium]
MKNILQQITSLITHTFFTLLVLAVGLSVLSGCATSRGAAGDGGGTLKKKVAITVFENRTQIASDEIRESFHRQFTAKLTRACSDTLLVTPEEKTFPDYLKTLPRLPSGLIDNYALAVTGRKYGFNAIVTGTLLDIKIDEEAYGFWWFKGSRPYIELLVGVEALDTETGAKILDERFVRKIKIRQDEFESLRSTETRTLPLLTKPLQQIADDMGVSICDAVNDQAWKGYIISVLPDKVILSAGKDNGLTPGDILEVYDSGSTISGHAGQLFFRPGLKIGEIRITAVYPNRSEAVVVSGTNITEGCTVKRR